ncbi:dihydroorotase [Formosimonas limnophila]|uniref:Dihydroorotase n=1 Tax=Formosimonas limnophila TaxID=1384487 RepID=A0A8J3CMP2_9BURK|nr:dihydroorotase [Formosimonas limnophila]GHA69836.1 dihydroorotase [Formosimonas limnophila]
MTSIDIIQPDDWHVHLRDGEALAHTVPHIANQFARAIVMPNLKPPVTNRTMAQDYATRIMEHVPEHVDFTPLMTLYLTDKTNAGDINCAVSANAVKAVKLYPAGATTNSDSGVTSLDHCDGALSMMQSAGLPLLVHGEVTDANVDIFDREAVFIDKVLIPLRARYPKLKIVLEHITTRAAAEYVATSEDGIAATITAHHLLYNRNHMLAGGIRPHYYCLPILKRESHREALIGAATSGNPRFFLGTDSAPHAQPTKETACGCAGCYTALHAMELYATAFEQAGALDKLEAFSSIHGAAFYGLPVNTRKIRLVKEDWQVPSELPYIEGQKLIPLNAGETLSWKFAGIV